MQKLLTRLTLAALVLRVLLPAGFMLVPQPGSALGLRVVICSGHAPGGALEKPGLPAPKKTHGAPGLCPFAASALPGVAPEFSLPVAAVRYAAAVYASTRNTISPVRWLGAGAARGPPFGIATSFIA